MSDELSMRISPTEGPEPQAPLIKWSAEEQAEFELQHQTADAELIIGLVAPVGTDVGNVSNALALVLRDAFAYEVTDLRLSGLLRELDWDARLEDKHLDEHIWTYMDAGNRLRTAWSRDDAMALLGVSKVRDERRLAQDRKEDLSRRAWVLNQLKTPAEVKTLRAVYGSRFVLIAASAPDDERERWLAEQIGKSRRTKKPERWGHPPRDLMDRDESEGRHEGQNVRETFHRADAFVDARAGSDLEQALTRVFEVFLGNPKRTPTKDEFGLFEASGAARVSSELGRQVGAALATSRGEIIALGTNDVPRPGGGLYWEDDSDPDVPDAREYSFRAEDERPEDPKFDTNDRMKREIATEISRVLSQERQWLDADTPADELLEAILSTRLGDLTEFGRAVHAEMAAILDAARNGRAIRGCVLYSTTFPCHNCARHVIAAGIARVVYVAPYAKSLAGYLHHDALAVAQSNPPHKLVRLEPFVGIAPRRYMDLFFGLERKEASGRVVEWRPETALPRLTDVDPPELRTNRPSYRVREWLMNRVLTDVQNSSSLQMRTETDSPSPRKAANTERKTRQSEPRKGSRARQSKAQRPRPGS